MRTPEAVQPFGGPTPQPAASRPKLAIALVLSISLSLFLASVYNSVAIVDGVPRQAIEMAISVLPLAGIAISAGVIRSRRVSFAPLVIAAGYSVATMISTIVASSDESIPVALSPTATALALALAGAMLVRRELMMIGRVIIIIGVLQAVVAIAEVQWIQGWAIEIASTPAGYVTQDNLVVSGLSRASAAMGHPILFGVLCSAGLVFVFTREALPNILLRVAVGALLAWGVVLSGSRSSIAAVAFAVVLFLVHRGSTMRVWARVGLVLVLVPTTVLYLATTAENAQVVSPFSLDNRVGAWGRFLATLNRPFGVVIFGQGSAFTLDTVADNQFLTTSGQYGLFGLALLIVALIYALLARSNVVASLTALIAVLFLSFDVMAWSFTTLLLWFLVGAAGASRVWSASIPQQDTMKPARPHTRRRERDWRTDHTSSGSTAPESVLAAGIAAASDTRS